MAGDNRKFLGGDRADERQHDLAAVRVAGEHERYAERRGFGQPTWIVREQDGHRRGVAHQSGDVDLALGPEPDPDEIDRLAVDPQSRARVLQYLNAVFASAAGMS